MCGIAGYTGRETAGVLERMVDAIRHRGPDGDGVWSDGKVHFCHTRLAIVDIEGGSQPMVREDGRCILTYNGEIYNYDDLRAKIEATGRRLTTNCDTELLPLGYAAFGPSFFSELIGIFAFALYDAREERLFLVRDHFGIKPLFYAETGSDIVFGSTVGAITCAPGIDKSLRAEALREFLQYRYQPSGCHFFQGVETLPPGSYLEKPLGKPHRVVSYWTPEVRSGDSDWSDKEWVERTETLLDDAIALQLRSDVPVGLFLSGGVDSSTIATFAARHCPYPMTAYTFSMRDADDEVAPARAIAESVGAQHVVVDTDNTDDFSGLYDAIGCMDLPVGDAIVLPTYQLCAAASRDHKVVLTGEGADEIFGGYVHFSGLKSLAKLRRVLPFADRLAPLVHLTPIPLLNLFFDYQASLGSLGRKKVARMIARIRQPGVLNRLASTIIDDTDIVRAADLGNPSPPADITLDLGVLMNDTVRTWLPYQILNKMDQLSMAHGLEARVPFLDPRLHDHLVTAPDRLILEGGQNKILLRQVLERQGGDWKRPKFAFHVPMERGYRKALERLCRSWLSSDQTKRHGIVRQGFIDENMQYLAGGDFIAAKRLVTMTALHMWLDANGHTG